MIMMKVGRNRLKMGWSHIKHSFYVDVYLSPKILLSQRRSCALICLKVCERPRDWVHKDSIFKDFDQHSPATLSVILIFLVIIHVIIRSIIVYHHCISYNTTAFLLLLILTDHQVGCKIRNAYYLLF